MQENVKLVTVKKTVRQAYRTEPIWQYDVGHVLNLEGFDNLPETFQMHYSHSQMGDAITQIGSNGQVSLPDEFAQTSAPIFAWVYVAEDDTGLTKYTIEIPVMRRAKITNQEPTPVEQSAIDQAISALNAGVARAETAAANAESSGDAAATAAQTATKKANDATSAATSAQGSASAASGSATAAGQSATAAAGSASAAAQTKTEIDDEVDGFQAQLTNLSSAVNDLGDVLVDEVSSTTTLSPMETETKKLLYISNSGNITDGSLDNQKVYAYNIEGYDGLHFNFYGRLNSEANYAFYSASELSGCDSTTVIGSVTAYVSGGADNYIDTIPSGAKTIVIGARQDGVMRGITNSIVSKADTALADPYSTTTVYSIGDYCTYDGKFYRRTTYTGTYGAWDATAWEQTKPSTEIETLNKRFADKLYFDSSLFQIGYVNSVGEISTSQKYKIVTTNIIHITETTKLVIEDLFGVGIYYYDAQGAYLSNNGWVESDQYLTILPDSYVRIVIQKDGSTATLSDNDIPIYSHTVTFASDYAKEQETIKNNAVGAIRALEAEMYQKGASPVLFPNAPCILVAGQSNIDGRVPKANLPASIVPPFDNIKNSINSVNGTFASSMKLPNSFGIDFSLYAALNDLGTPWYIIKRSIGGTSISPFGDSAYHWTPFYEELDDISKSLLYTFNTQIAKCAEVNPNTYNIRALIWQQGEGDRASTSKKAALDYYTNFKCLIAYIRGIAGDEKLPVVCGTVSHLSGQYDPTVEEATLRVAEEDPYLTCIDMSGAGLLDAYHFDSESAVYFGYKAFDALIDFGVVSGTKINPTPPWET